MAILFWLCHSPEVTLPLVEIADTDNDVIEVTRTDMRMITQVITMGRVVGIWVLLRSTALNKRLRKSFHFVLRIPAWAVIQGSLRNRITPQMFSIHRTCRNSNKWMDLSTGAIILSCVHHPHHDTCDPAKADWLGGFPFSSVLLLAFRLLDHRLAFCS